MSYSRLEGVGAFIRKNTASSMIFPISQMLDDDAFEKRRSDVGIPNSFRIHDDDRSTRTHAEARRFAAFDSTRSEQQPFALEQRRK